MSAVGGIHGLERGEGREGGETETGEWMEDGSNYAWLYMEESHPSYFYEWESNQLNMWSSQILDVTPVP